MQDTDRARGNGVPKVCQRVGKRLRAPQRKKPGETYVFFDRGAPRVGLLVTSCVVSHGNRDIHFRVLLEAFFK